MAGLLLLAGMALTAGCAASNARDSAQRDPRQQDLLKAWKDASKRQAEEVDAEDAKPLPEPRLQPMTHFSAGALYEKQGCYAMAIEQYRKAIELNPAFAGAHNRLGLCYTKTGQFRLAVEVLTKASELRPKSVAVWNNLGFAQLAAGNPVAAESSLAKALAIQPMYERARTNMALALARQGRDQDALSHLEVVSPDYIALYNLGSMQLAAGRAEQARSSFEQALKVRTEFPAARRGLDQATARLALAPATQPALVAGTAQAARAPSTRPSAAIAEASRAEQTTVATPVAPPQTSPAPPAADSLAASTPADGEGVASDAGTADKDTARAEAYAPNEDPAQTCAANNEPASVAGQSGAQGLLTGAVPLAAGSMLAGCEGTGWIDPAIALLAPDLAAWPNQTHASAEDQILRMASDLATRDLCRPAPSVADMDLVSLQWFAWRQATETLQVDVQSLPEHRLVQVMRKWLMALEQLQDLARPAYPAVAMAR